MNIAYQCAKMLYGRHLFNPMPLPVAVLVKDGRILRVVASAHGAHQHEGHCARLAHNVPSGTRYDLCPHCDPRLHAEALAVKGLDARGADVYVYGHWYFCAHCRNTLSLAGVNGWFVLEDAHRLFQPGDPGCVIGKPGQFAL